jgi:hypothetical protein
MKRLWSRIAVNASRLSPSAAVCAQKMREPPIADPHTSPGVTGFRGFYPWKSGGLVAT